MNNSNVVKVHIGPIFEEDTLTLEQLCCMCGVRTDWVMDLVAESIIEPDGREVSAWRFSGASLMRVYSALSLERDLGVNLAGIGLALDLLEELERLRMLIKCQPAHR